MTKVSKWQMVRSCDFDYAYDALPLFGFTEEVVPFSMCFSLSECKLLLPDLTTIAPNLILDGE